MPRFLEYIRASPKVVYRAWTNGTWRIHMVLLVRRACAMLNAFEVQLALYVRVSSPGVRNLFPCYRTHWTMIWSTACRCYQLGVWGEGRGANRNIAQILAFLDSLLQANFTYFTHNLVITYLRNICVKSRRYLISYTLIKSSQMYSLDTRRGYRMKASACKESLIP